MTALDRARWLSIEPLLDHALELSVEEQERWLASLETTAPDDARERRAVRRGAPVRLLCELCELPVGILTA